MRVLIGGLVLVLSACAAKDPLPADYSGPTAYLLDTVLVESTSKANFFYASELDGKRIRDSLSATREKSYGMGFRMDVETVNREIPVRPLKVKLEGKVGYAAPILEIANFKKLYEASAVVAFEPIKGATYVVRGKLESSGSEVWLEDSRGKRVGTYVSVEK